MNPVPAIAENIPENSKVRVSWPHAVLSVIGFGISLYALRVHHIIKSGGDAGCGFTETISCDKVLASRYAEIFGIPLGAFGMAFFVVVLLTAINTNPDFSPRREAGWRLLVTALGFAGSVALTYISHFLIHALCPVCLATHATNLLLFLASLWQYFKAPRTETRL